MEILNKLITKYELALDTHATSKGFNVSGELPIRLESLRLHIEKLESLV